METTLDGADLQKAIGVSDREMAGLMRGGVERGLTVNDVNDMFRGMDLIMDLRVGGGYLGRNETKQSLVMKANIASEKIQPPAEDLREVILTPKLAEEIKIRFKEALEGELLGLTVGKFKDGIQLMAGVIPGGLTTERNQQIMRDFEDAQEKLFGGACRLSFSLE